MENVSPLVLAVEQLAVVRGRMDAAHSDSSQDAGGDGWVGDGLNIPADGAGGETGIDTESPARSRS